MTKEELARIREIHDRLDALDAAGQHEDAEIFYRKHAPAFQWDRNGNFIGTVQHENGWTP